MKKFKVAVDKGTLTGGHAVRGIGVHTGQLVDALEKIDSGIIEVMAVDFSKTDLGEFDLVHYQYFHPYFLTLPIRKKTKSIVTIHDLIYLLYPKAYPAGLKGKIWFLVQKYLIKNMDAIITISETSKKDIVRYLNIPADKIHVIHLAPKKIFHKLPSTSALRSTVVKKYDLPESFVLNVGGVNYNKNLLTLADACKKINTPLVLVGKATTNENFDKFHPENKPWVEFLEKYGTDPQILRLGYVPDEDLDVLYSLAVVYCQPSYYEGFGLGVLEAQAAGTPVVASKINAHQEIAGDSVLYFDPKNTVDLSEKIRTLIKNSKLRTKFLVKGLENAKKFSWQKTAEKTLNVYKKVIQGKKD